MPSTRGLQKFVSSMKDWVPALKEPNYRLYIIGQAIWIPGAWIFGTSVKWLCYDITGTYQSLGILGFFTTLPFLLLSPFATSISDSFTRRKTVLYFQSIRIATFPILAILVWTKTITFPLLVLLVVIESSAVAMQFPSKLTLLMDLVGPEKMVSAAGFASVVMNVGRIVGPAVAGYFLSFGPAWAFITAFLLSIPFLIVLTKLKTSQVRQPTKGNVFKQFSQGAKYVFRRPRPVLILSIISASAILGYGVELMMPGIAKDILHLGPGGYGFMVSSIGIGALVAAILLATKAGFGIPVRIFSLSAIILPLVGIFIGIAIWIKSVPLVILGFMVFGFVIANQNSLGRSILPLLVNRKYAGRVMGFFSTAMMGLKPFGELLTGFTASILASTSLIGSALSVPTTIFILYGLLLGVGSFSGLRLLSIIRRTKEPVKTS